MSDNKQWWEGAPLAPLGNGRSLSSEWGSYNLGIRALREGLVLYDTSQSGALAGTKAEVLKKVEEAGGRLVAFAPDMDGSEEDQVLCYTYVWDDTIVGISFVSDGWDYRVSSTNKELFYSLCNSLKVHITERKSAGSVYVLISDDSGPRFVRLGIAAVPFEEGNYNETVVKEYNHIIQDLDNTTPCGRLVILDGEPGTGKTFLVRGILNDIKNCIFIMVPANMVSALSSPSLLPALLGLKANRSGDEPRPAVFIIEDADSCLVPRASDNMDSISALLNFCDGILGSLVDIRIICTTNAKADQMDRALIRPGRLCRRVEVGKIGGPQAKAVYQRLTGKFDDVNKFKDNKAYTIAEVYRAAIDDGWEPPKSEKAVGFSKRAPAGLPWDDDF